MKHKSLPKRIFYQWQLARKIKQLQVKRFLEKKTRQVKSWPKRVELWLKTGKEGHLSYYLLYKLAKANLLNSLSRSGVTVFAIASGTAAIVFLVGFAYGLQNIVNDRLIQPNSLKLADIQTSSTALELNVESLAQIASMTEVSDVSPAISLAASMKFNQSKTEVVVLGVANTFLDYAHIKLIDGENFSDEAEAKYDGPSNEVAQLLRLQAGEDSGADEAEETGEVAGAYDEQEIIWGEPINSQTLYFRIPDGDYIPIRSAPSIDAPIIAYSRGSIVSTYRGREVWGSTYPAVSTAGKAFQDADGEWSGRWMQVNDLPAYDKDAGVLSARLVVDSQNLQTTAGFVSEDDLEILSADDFLIEKMLSSSMGEVLGDSTISAGISEEASASVSATSLDSSGMTAVELEDASVTADMQALKAALAKEEEVVAASNSAALSAVLSIPKEGGKEIMLSTGVLDLWQLSAKDIVGQNMNLEYIVSGGLIPGFNGRALTMPLDYKVVGVFEDNRSLVYVPLSDLQSLGITRYSTAKMLASEQHLLAPLREKIEALGFVTNSIADTLDQVDRLFRVMRFLLGSFGMIAFIVALFGMFNTLTISLLERTREIGVMKTLGTTDQDVKRLMMMESTLIGIAGGIAGIFFGFIIAKLVDLLAGVIRGFQFTQLFSFPFYFLVLVLLLSIVVGFLTGLYPAKRSREISALDALRYE